MHPLLSVPLPRLLAILAFTFLQVSATLAAGTRKNVTVDDTNGSSTGVQIAYSPPGAWSVGQNCTACQAKLDKNQAFDGSWHDVSFISDNPPPTPISASLTFDGKSLAVIVTTSARSHTERRRRGVRVLRHHAVELRPERELGPLVPH